MRNLKLQIKKYFKIPLGGRSISPDVSPIKFGRWAWTLCRYMGLEVLVILGASGLYPSVSYESSNEKTRVIN